MGPKKKFRSAKRNKLGNVGVSSMYLSFLPDEVLLLIYQYLSPVDLIALSKLDERFNKLTFSLREANFSACRRISPEQVNSFLCTSRVKFIQKLNFNYIVFLKPSDLVRTICRCKNLVSLSIICCGVTDRDLSDILEECCKLEELAWSVCEVYGKFNLKSSSLKKVYLEGYWNPKYHESFPNIERMFIAVSSDFMLGSPFMGMGLKTWCVSSPKVQVFVVNGLLYCDKIRQVILPDSDNEMDMYDDMDMEERCHRYRCWDCPPYLAIRSAEEDISTLSSSHSDKYSSLTLHITTDVDSIADSLADRVSKVCGLKLNYLCLNSEECRSAIDISYVFEKICISCRNITTLDLRNVHFNGSPFKAMCHLRNLKVLSLATCAFGKNFEECCREGLSSEEELTSFQEVVSSCPNVRDFVFTHCLEAYYTQDDMAPICNWKELRQLSVYNVDFRNYGVLRNIADSCTKLESFSLINDTIGYGPLITYDIIYLLQTARNLSFIRINCHDFNSMFERFWSSIAGARNLEGICILTTKTDIKRQIMFRAIKQLPNLHLFHINVHGMYWSFYAGVKKCMAANGIVNMKLEATRANVPDGRTSGAPLRHKLPYSSCCILHLNEIIL